MGIHGEPGLRTTRHLTAAELTDELVGNLLPELPEPPPGGRGRVAVLLNGLGRTKYEELFVVYRQVNRRLREAGLRPFRPEVGEFVTSFDMAGVSLSLMLLDDELAELYDAPCDTPAFRSLPGAYAAGDDERAAQAPPTPAAATASDAPADAQTDARIDVRMNARTDARTDAQPGARAVVPAGPPTGTPGGHGPLRDAAPQPLRDDIPPGGGLPVIGGTLR